MENHGDKKKKPEPFHRVVVQVLVPYYDGLDRVCFQDGEEVKDGPLDRGRCLGPVLELSPMEINEGSVTMNLVLN